MLRAAGATATAGVRESEAERLRFWSGRKNAFPAAGRISPDYYCMDGTIPRRNLGRMLSAIADMEHTYELGCMNVFHAGDGNLHPLILFDANDADQWRRAERFGAEILELCVEFGGTVTGEHGVGIEKINSMCVQFSPEERETFFAVKRAFDPPGLLNPGKAIPTLARCAEYGKMHVHAGRLRVPGSAALLRAPRMTSDHGEAGRPGSRSGIGAMRERVLAAAATRRPLRLRGGGTKDFYGQSLDGEVLDTRGYRGIVGFEPTELVVTARCGTPLAELGRRWPRHRQMLPSSRRPSAATPTVGGVVAAGLSGPRRAAAGAVRDFVLGAVLLDGAGRLKVFGGQVMKNVAGYDVSRLLCGSLGIARADRRGVAEGAAVPARRGDRVDGDRRGRRSAPAQRVGRPAAAGVGERVARRRAAPAALGRSCGGRRRACGVSSPRTGPWSSAMRPPTPAGQDCASRPTSSSRATSRCGACRCRRRRPSSISRAAS